MRDVGHNGMSSESPTSTFDPTRLIQQHQTNVWRYLRSLGCEAALAEDLTQETFLKVLQSVFEHRDDRSTAAYLRTVARNLFISHQRRQGKVVEAEEVDLIDAAWQRWNGDASGAKDGLLERLRACFSRLTARAQLSLRLRFEDKASRQEIAEQLSISEHGAKNLMQRAKQQLRECMDSKVVE